MDYISYHPYDWLKDPDDSNFIEDTKKLKNLIMKYGGEHKMWISEVGWAVRKEVSEQEQARYLVKEYVYALSTKIVEKIFWYDLQSGQDPNDREQNFGINRWDLSPRPSFFAYKTMAKNLEGLKFIKEIELAENIKCFLFGNDEKKVGVIWKTNDEEDALIMINKNLKSLKVENLYGEEIYVRDGKLILLDDPQYVKVGQNESFEKVFEF